ncbi:GNAT family N-acetyltransferase [Roseovarius sp. SCSIO 43702]|nr:GNAT family N-acetyltransferase [Roseovarius sp. SCSIO 43702]
MATLRKDVDLQKMLLGARDIIEEPVGEWLDRRDADGWIRSIVDGKDSCLGYVQLSDIHRNNRTAWFGICLLPDVRGRGHGMTATMQTLEIGRKEMGLRKVSLKVRADNPACRLYKRIGFRLVGTQRAEYDDGKTLHDVTIMEFIFSEHGN